jgi:hypothetical protein
VTVLRMGADRDGAQRQWWSWVGSWYGLNSSVFEVGVALNAPGSSAPLARSLANLSMKRSGTLSCSAIRSLHSMFAPITPRTKSPSTKHEVKQDWEKLYRAAIIEPAPSKLLQRVEVAETAIVERSRRLSKSRTNSGKEQEAITRALHILSILRAKAREWRALLRDEENASLKKGLEFLLGRYFSSDDSSSCPSAFSLEEQWNRDMCGSMTQSFSNDGEKS